MMIFIRCLAENKHTLSSWNSFLLQNETNLCKQHIIWLFFAEKEVNELMEELFETVSNDPQVTEPVLSFFFGYISE